MCDAADHHSRQRGHVRRPDKPLNTSTSWARHVVYKIPLCGNSPGNVGWLDWSPPGGGGEDGLACAIENPNNPPFDLPSWQWSCSPGTSTAAEEPATASR